VKLGLFDVNHDHMASNSDRNAVEDNTQARHIERRAPDHHQLGSDDWIANDTKEAVRDQAARSVRWKGSTPTLSAEGVEASNPDTNSDRKQDRAAPGSDERWKWEHLWEKLMGSPGKGSHEKAEEEHRVEERLGPERRSALSGARPASKPAD
jgi:hypothetical protein